jgi:signal peptidase II
LPPGDPAGAVSPDRQAVEPVVPAPAPPDAPPHAESAAVPARAGLIWTVIAAIVILDQLVKAVVVATLPLYSATTVIPGLLDFVHVRNAGVAFGLMNTLDHPQRGVLTSALALVALASIVFYSRYVQPHERVARFGLSLILGGAIGNLIDRLRQGYVVDFVDFYFRGWHFWAFNVADAAITVGAILVCIDILLLNRHAPDPV